MRGHGGISCIMKVVFLKIYNAQCIMLIPIHAAQNVLTYLATDLLLTLTYPCIRLHRQMPCHYSTNIIVVCDDDQSNCPMSFLSRDCGFKITAMWFNRAETIIESNRVFTIFSFNASHVQMNFTVNVPCEKSKVIVMIARKMCTFNRYCISH